MNTQLNLSIFQDGDDIIVVTQVNKHGTYFGIRFHQDKIDGFVAGASVSGSFDTIKDLPQLELHEVRA